MAACASAGPPPGGPEDHAAPQLLRVTPDTNAVNVGAENVTFTFDETINDRGGGSTQLGDLFLVSPRDGAPHVSWHRSRIDVRPRHGFRPNTAYTVTLLPGIADLRNNTMKSGATVTFSTGPSIPQLRLAGIVFDWVAEKPAANALVEATTPDSVTYVAQADTGGRFTIGPFGPGTYLVRATIDQNRNRARDRGESWDSLVVTAPQTDSLELLAAPRDTLPPRLESVAFTDSVTLRLTFDRLLDPTQRLAADSFSVVGADSAAIAVTAVRTPKEDAERQQQLAGQAADSARRADSVAGRPRAGFPRGLPVAAADSAAPKPSRAPPFTSVSIVVARPLKPSTSYRARARSVRALSGRSASSDRLFNTPRPTPAPAATDSTGRTAPAQPPATPPASRP
ncbi:MAG TPA: Ig-like domain-containing protein [Nannocystaceae bacterium]|nr:Ig-like domain-containing protein [Nannocystaceae bacterium]